MSFYDALLVLHVFGAFALMGAITLFSIGIVATWRAKRPSDVVGFARIRRAGELRMVAGILMTVVFGVWLAIDVDRYQVWDEWVIAAIALWAIAAETGRRSADACGQIGAEAARLAQAGDTAEPQLVAKAHGVQALGMHVAFTAAVLLVLVDMIWKPGARVMLAAIRPHSWDPALFLHVLGSMVFVGALVAAAVALCSLSAGKSMAPGSAGSRSARCSSAVCRPTWQ